MGYIHLQFRRLLNQELLDDISYGADKVKLLNIVHNKTQQVNVSTFYTIIKLR